MRMAADTASDRSISGDVRARGAAGRRYHASKETKLSPVETI